MLFVRLFEMLILSSVFWLTLSFGLKKASSDFVTFKNSACKLILSENYRSYENALKTLNIESLFDRREILCLDFAKKCLRNEKMKILFKENPKIHEMETRNKEKYDITHARTSRFKKSSIIYMQRLLNEQ